MQAELSGHLWKERRLYKVGGLIQCASRVLVIPFSHWIMDICVYSILSPFLIHIYVLKILCMYGIFHNKTVSKLKK